MAATATISITGGGTPTAQCRSGRRPRSYRPWTPADEQQMLQLRADGMPYTQIAVILQRSLGSCYARADQMRQRVRPAFRCSRCTLVLPAEAFNPTMRREGAYCRACARRGKTVERPSTVAAWWLTKYLHDHDGLATRTDCVAAGTAAGLTESSMQAAIQRWPGLAYRQRWADDPIERRKTISWWMFTDKVEEIKAADTAARYQRRHGRHSKKYWTPDEDTIIDQMRTQGAVAREIGAVLGRTAGAVRQHEGWRQKHAARTQQPTQ